MREIGVLRINPGVLIWCLINRTAVIWPKPLDLICLDDPLTNLITPDDSTAVTTATSTPGQGSPKGSMRLHTHTHTSRVSGRKCPAGSYLKEALWCRQWEVSPSSIKKMAASKKDGTSVSGSYFFLVTFEGSWPKITYVEEFEGVTAQRVNFPYALIGCSWILINIDKRHDEDKCPQS